jgi:hypothetical protein
LRARENFAKLFCGGLKSGRDFVFSGSALECGKEEEVGIRDVD